MNGCECGEEVANEDRMGESALRCNTKGCSETVWLCRQLFIMILMLIFFASVSSAVYGSNQRRHSAENLELSKLQAHKASSFVIFHVDCICFSEMQRNIPKCYVFPIKTCRITKFRRYRGRG